MNWTVKIGVSIRYDYRMETPIFTRKIDNEESRPHFPGSTGKGPRIL